MYNFIRRETTACAEFSDELLEKAQINENLQQALCKFDLVSPWNLKRVWK